MPKDTTPKDSYAENARQDKLNRDEYAGYLREKAKEKEENEAPRKALGEAFDYVKGQASKLGSEVSKFAKEYGDVYKKGLGMKKGGKISLKDCRVNTAETRNSKHKSW